MRAILRVVVGVAVGIPVLILFGGILCGPPLMVLLETIDLVRMREQTRGVVDAVAIQDGGHGTSRARITYHFDVAGRQVTSDRYLPGYFGNFGTWTGGAAVARDFAVGQQVPVYYRQQNPEACALEYGWFCWSVALCSLWIGVPTMCAGSGERWMGWRQNALWYGGWASIVYGFGLIFLGPSVVRVHQLHWHALAWCGALALSVFYACLRRSTTPQEPSKVIVLGNEIRPTPAAHEQSEVRQESTTDLVLGFVFVTGCTLAVIVPGLLFLFGNGIPPMNFAVVLLLAVLAFFAWGGSRTVWSIGRELFRRYSRR